MAAAGGQSIAPPPHRFDFQTIRLQLAADVAYLGVDQTGVRKLGLGPCAVACRGDEKGLTANLVPGDQRADDAGFHVGQPELARGLPLGVIQFALKLANALLKFFAAVAHHAAEEVKTQISELQALVADLCRRSRGAGHQELPESLFRLYTDLIEAEVSDGVARDLLERLRRETTEGEREDTIMLRSRLARMIESDIAVAGPIHVETGRRRLVALVGPTGVGKTTTIAKLAANFRLREKKRVGLITVDTYRIAAVEQLRTYADIIDLPMHVVSTPREMRDAVNSLSSMDLVLLDTAGRSPHDDVKIQELKSFLLEAAADEVHLVLSATAGAASLEKTAKQFAAVYCSSFCSSAFCFLPLPLA